MRRLKDIAVRLMREKRGDVLLEYVLITCAIILPLVGIVNGVFDPSGQMFNPSGDPSGNFGVLGNSFKDCYQRIVCGIGLPIP